MSPQMGPPETVIHEYPGADRSWELEFADFARAVEMGGPPNGNLGDAVKALRIVDALYGVKSP